jgi:hypothetical protein
VKGDDGIHVTDTLELRLVKQYRELDDRNQKSIRRIAHSMLAHQGGKPMPKPKRRRRGVSEADTLKQWARDFGKIARRGSK